MNLDQMRAEFEQRFPPPRGVYWGGSCYLYTAGEAYSVANAIKWDARWETWQASRACLVVVIPKPEYFGDHWSGDWAIKPDDVREALEAAGARWKNA